MLNELDVVRLLESFSFDTFDEGTVNIPAGAEGTVLDIYDDGKAFGVDFTLEEPRFAPDEEVLDPGWFEYVIVPAASLELETPWKA